MSTTYVSDIDIGLGQVPDTLDPVLYSALQDAYSAIQILANSVQYREVASISVDADYTIVETDGLIRVDATAGDVDITLPLSTEVLNYQYIIKRVDNTGNTVTVAGTASEPVDGLVAGFTIAGMASYTVHAVSGSWDLV